MDNWNEIDESLGAKLGGKYSYTSANGGIYYYWNKSNDKKLIDPVFNWKGYFDIPEPIQYRSTEKPTGEIKEVEFPAVKKFNIKKRIVKIPQSEPTGYLTPRFHFINSQFNRYVYKGDEYKETLKVFGIKEKGIIPPEKIPIISNYRDTLLSQLNRQADELTKLNEQIANVLKVYYYESEQAILKGDSKDYSDEEIKKRVKDRTEVLQNIRNLFEALILTGASSELIESHSMTKRIHDNGYVSKHLKEAAIHGVIFLTKKKDPLIKMAVQLAHKINPLESILEDAFLNDRVKSKNQFELDERFKQLPEPESVAYKFCNRENNKAGKYDTAIITKALTIVRSYIFDNKLNSIKGKVRTVSKEILEKDNSFNGVNPKTLDAWVKFYWSEYKPTDQAQTKH